MDNKQKNNRRSVFGNILIILGLLLIAASIGLTVYNLWDAERAAQESNAIADILIKEIGDDFVDGITVLPYTDANTPMPTKMIDGYEYIGILEIPSESLTLPVMSKWDYDRLKIAPCRFTGSYYSNDLVICGHNYSKHFSPIKWMDIGEDIYFINVEGLTIRYIVVNRETLQPTDVDLMVDNKNNNKESTMDWDMTLFTCNIGGQTRCAVRCSRVDTEYSGEEMNELP